MTLVYKESHIYLLAVYFRSSLPTRNLIGQPSASRIRLNGCSRVLHGRNVACRKNMLVFGCKHAMCVWTGFEENPDPEYCFRFANEFSSASVTLTVTCTPPRSWYGLLWFILATLGKTRTIMVSGCNTNVKMATMLRKHATIGAFRTVSVFEWRYTMYGSYIELKPSMEER